MRALSVGLLAVVLVQCRRVPPIDEEYECRSRLSGIGGLLLAYDEKGLLRFPGGEAFLLQIAPELKPNQMRVFVCPADPDRETVHCSYRAHPAGKLEAAWQSEEPVIIACCACGDDGDEPWHEDGVCVLLSNGRAGFRRWEDMEGSDGGPVRVGPGSPDPRFRDLVR